jgi:hypothetical protein
MLDRQDPAFEAGAILASPCPSSSQSSLYHSIAVRLVFPAVCGIIVKRCMLKSMLLDACRSRISSFILMNLLIQSPKTEESCAEFTCC